MAVAPDGQEYFPETRVPEVLAVDLGESKRNDRLLYCRSAGIEQ
jgi:hypothetical protein